ncbi:hypothetical protein HWV62_35454 [Athelia sp. TMB]|nr:hypothetical protein HWV62_35454 [Athelia sp. TMB]
MESAESILCKVASEAVPCLRVFQISTDDELSYPMHHTKLVQPLFSSSTPSLHTMTMSGIGPMKCGALPANLTHLELKVNLVDDGFSPKDFAIFLNSAAPTLRYIVLEGIVIAFDLSEKPSAKIELPALVSLNIRYPIWGDAISYIEDLWSCIRTSALQDLTLCNLNDAELHDTMRAIQDQREQGRFAEIKSLCLEDTYMNHYTSPDYVPEEFYTADSMVDDLMMAFPKVCILMLSGDAVVSVLNLMLETDRKNVCSDTGTLWPNLQCLIVVHPQETLLRDVVLSRKAVGHPISELKIQKSRGFSDKTTDWLRRRVPKFSTSNYISRAGVVSYFLRRLFKHCLISVLRSMTGCYLNRVTTCSCPCIDWQYGGHMEDFNSN